MLTLSGPDLGLALLLLTLSGPDLGLALLVEELHRVEQLLDIVQRTGRLGGVLGPVSADDTRTSRNFESQVVQPLFGPGQRQPPDEGHELGHFADDGLLHGIRHRLGRQRIHRFPHRQITSFGQQSDPLYGRIADTPRRVIDDPLEGLVVAGVDNQPNIGQQILDLLVVVERIALVNTIGYSFAAQRVFERLGLVVGAVQNRCLGPLIARSPHLVAQVADHHFGLLAVGIGSEHADLFAHIPFRKALLLHAFRITFDHRIGRLDDRARRAVILLQLEDHRVGEILLERKDVLDLGPPERIDRLGVVAHHADLRMELRQAPDDDVLGIVGILVLIDQDVFELLLVAGRHVGTVSQQDIGLQQQVVEIHRPVPLAAGAIDVVDVAELGNLHPPVFGYGTRIGQVSARRHQAVLGVGDARGEHRRLILGIVQVQLLDDGFQKVLAIRRLVNRKTLREADPFGVVAQNARENRVEGSHADIAVASVRQHLGDTFAHLLGGLVGEGEGEDVVRSHPLLNHIGDARSKNARLARPGARDDERRRIVVHHRIPLGLIQAFQYLRFHNVQI